jgi:Domain of unknown function (DUF4383)
MLAQAQSMGGARVGTSGRFLQIAAAGLCLVQLAYAGLGLATNPDFATGHAATAERLLGVDFNGWHAVSGFLLFGPGLIAAFRRTWAWYYCVAVIIVLLGAAAWGLLDHRPLALLFFPDAGADAVFHVVSAASFAAVLAADVFLRRREARTSSCDADRGPC